MVLDQAGANECINQLVPGEREMRECMLATD